MKAAFKQGLVTILILIAAFKTHSQEVPYFETTFYFEDALGNTDSLILGYDKNIDPFKMNTSFGEKEISTPFDSIFEVRALHLSNEELMSKKIIGFAEDSGPYLVSSNTLIIVRILNKPLKVSYDVKKFSKEARSGSFLTHTTTKNLVGPFAIKDWEYFCLSDVDHHYFTFPDSLYENFSNKGYAKMYEIEGGILDTLYGIEIAFGPYNCLFPTGTENFSYVNLKSYPTASFSDLMVVMPENITLKNIKLVSITGMTIQPNVLENGNIISLDISNLESGLYFGIINDNYYFKFIKLR